RLRDQRDHGALHTRARERVLQRLLDHVAHPAGGPRYQHAKRQRLDLIGGDLVARQLIADLRAVPVDQDDVPSRRGEIHDRDETRARMPELIADRLPLTGGSDGVSLEGSNDEPTNSPGSRSRGGSGADGRQRWSSGPRDLIAPANTPTSRLGASKPVSNVIPVHTAPSGAPSR